MSIKFAESMEEVGNALHVVFSDGSTRNYDAVKLAEDWLCMSNDDFYGLHGFNYVPSQRIQSAARSQLNR